MTRDMDCIRFLLLEIEAAGRLGVGQFTSEEFDRDMMVYNLRLLYDAGFINGKLLPVPGGDLQFDIRGLTWSGHDLLDAIKNDTIWSKTKKTIAEKGGGATMEIIKAIAFGYAKAHFGLSG